MNYRNISRRLDLDNMTDDEIIQVDILPPIWDKLPRRRIKTQEERVIDEILRRDKKKHTFARVKEILHQDIIQTLEKKGYRVEYIKNQRCTFINWKNTIKVEQLGKPTSV